MSIVIPKNTTVAVERRIPFVLVDATDLITPEDISVTGVKATLSFGAGTDAASTNDIIKIDGVLGLYAIELTQAESNNAAGPIIGTIAPAGCARTYFVAQIGPNSLYAEGSTSTQIRDAILNWEPYAGYSLARLLRVLGIVLRGTLSGGRTGTEVMTAPAGGATVTATTDANGNRTVVSDTASGTP